MKEKKIILTFASIMIAEAKFAHSGFTQATLRGATYIGEDTLEDRINAALRALRQYPLVYLYIPELDRIGHHAGVHSQAWVSMLEQLDAAVATLAAASPGGMLVTADHGMVDVPEFRHVILRAPDAEIAHVAGEPRAPQLHLSDPQQATAVAAAFAEELGESAWVATRDELIASGWLGPVHEHVLRRLGDVLIAARGTWAFYLSEHDPARGMLGQHGSFTDGELRVPLARFGSWA